MKSCYRPTGRRIAKDEHGDILGMPLYLVIIIIIAGMGLVILVAWFATIDRSPSTSIELTTTPNTIYIYDDGSHGDGAAGDGIYGNDNIVITVLVKDNNGKEVSGVSLSLDGMGLKTAAGERVTGTADSDGKAVFTGLRIIDQVQGDGKITVNGDHSDKSDTTFITVRWQ